MMMQGQLSVFLCAFVLFVAVSVSGWVVDSSSAVTAQTIYGDVVVRDSNTKFVWQQSTADTNGDGSITPKRYPEGDMMIWRDATNYCRSVVFAGSSDWRLPDIKQLLTIVDLKHSYPAIAPVFQCESSYYWSASTSEDKTSDARYVHFNFGTEYTRAKEQHAFVRCIRIGQ